MRFLVHNRHASLIFSVLVVVVLCAQSCAILGDPIDYSLPGSSGPWHFPGKNIGECCHFLHQGFFPTQGSNSHLLYPLHWPADFLPLRHLGSPLLGLACNWYWVLWSLLSPSRFHRFTGQLLRKPASQDLGFLQTLPIVPDCRQSVPAVGVDVCSVLC